MTMAVYFERFKHYGPKVAALLSIVEERALP